MACTDEVEGYLRDAGSFDAFKANMEATLNGTGVTSVTQATTDLLGNMTTCLSLKRANIGTLATDISTKQSRLAELRRGGIDIAKEQAEIAKQRVAYTRESGRHVSYYEGWFAIGRPLQNFMIILLLTLSLVLTLGSIFFLASMFGYSVTVITPPSGAPGPPNPLVQYLAQFGAPFWILLVAVIIGFIYYRRKAAEKEKEKAV
jgi:hypothetical protein